MSYVFEGVLLPRSSSVASGRYARSFCASVLGGIPVEFAALDNEITAIVRVDTRIGPFSGKFEELATVLSSTFGKALVVRYDDRIDHCASSYFEDGFERASFGEEDQVYSLLDDDGAPTGGRVSFDEIGEEEFEEYDVIVNAIELGLERFGCGRWEDMKVLISFLDLFLEGNLG